MELTPQLLTDEIDFRVAVRGYDRNEVDDFLERVAVAVGQLQTQLTKAVARAKAAEARLAELEGDGATAGEAPSTGAEAPGERAEEPRGDAEASRMPKAPPAAPVTEVGDDEDLNDELRRTLVLAQRTADTAIREAHEEAREIIEQAHEEARRNREEADRALAKAREDAHGRLVGEIRELEATRESMRDDVGVLERHLGAERARVRETIQVLRRLVDEPDSFRTKPIPELSGAAVPVALGPAPSVTPPDEAGAAEADAAEPAPSEASSSGGAAPSAGDGPGAAPSEATEAEATQPEATEADAPQTDAELGTEPSPADAGASDADTGSEPGDQPSESPEASDPAEAADAEGRTGEPSAAEAEDAEQLGQLFSSADSTRDWRSSGPERGDQGPHTQPVAAARFEEESDEAFLAELRRAMNDDEPLGPGDEK